MLAVLDEIEACLHGDHFLAALQLSLTVPEIAAALASETGRGGEGGYRAWFDAHLKPLYPSLGAEDCLSLRLGLAPKDRRVLFTVPSAQGDAFHNEVFNGALNLDTPTFCRDVSRAARAWLEAEAGNPTVARNLERALRPRPAGLDPFMVGVPLIA